jgi:site-specific DNA recombinase
MKALILSRVSSKDQEEGYSIAAQTEKLKEYCKHKGLDVLKVFEITESSTVGDRKQFKELLAYAKELHAKTHQRLAIIVDAVDRLMRNFTDQAVLNDLMNQDIIELHFARTGGIVHKDSTSNDKLMWNIQIVMAQNYVDSLKDNVKRSIDYKIKQGEYISQAPIGYLNVPKSQRQDTDIVLDESRCFLVKRLFQEYATGTHSLGDMVALAKRWGLRSKSGKNLPKSHVHRILQDPFYIGTMTIKGKEYQHRYPPLVDNETFAKCQQVRLNANKKPFKYAEKPFLFRGLLRCKDCGCAYTSYIKKERYIYLRPTHRKPDCQCMPVREEVALSQVNDVFKAIQMPETLASAIREHLKKSHESKINCQEKAIAALRKEYDDTKRKLDRLVDLLIEQSITQSIYDTKVYELRNRQREIEHRLTAHTDADETFNSTLSVLIGLTAKADECFARANIEQKRKLLTLIFANLEMQGPTLCYSLRKPFDVLAELPQTAEWRTRRDSNPQPSA